MDFIQNLFLYWIELLLCRQLFTQYMRSVNNCRHKSSSIQTRNDKTQRPQQAKKRRFVRLWKRWIMLLLWEKEEEDGAKKRILFTRNYLLLIIFKRNCVIRGGNDSRRDENREREKKSNFCGFEILRQWVNFTHVVISASEDVCVFFFPRGIMGPCLATNARVTFLNILCNCNTQNYVTMESVTFRVFLSIFSYHFLKPLNALPLWPEPILYVGFIYPRTPEHLLHMQISFVSLRRRRSSPLASRWLFHGPLFKN